MLKLSLAEDVSSMPMGEELTRWFFKHSQFKDKLSRLDYKWSCQPWEEEKDWHPSRDLEWPAW